MAFPETAARLCSRHPWLTMAAWAVAIVLALAAIVLLLPGRLTTEGAGTNNPQSQRAESTIEDAGLIDRRSAFTDIVIVRSDRYEVDSPAFNKFLLAEAAAIAGQIGNAPADLPELPRLTISRDRHAVLVPISVDDDQIGPVIDAVDRADSDPSFDVSVTGEQTLDHDFNELSQHDLKSGELQFGLPAALVILLLVFGAVVAGLVPILMAIVSIVVALGLTAVLAQPFGLSVFVVNMLTGMGLALGIDYSLFVVSRYREERGAGKDQFDAIGASGATASRAVLFSGTAFVVAMFGMLLVPSSIMQSLAAGAILVGIVSVAAALTLLPALLGAIGDGVNALRIPFVGSRSIEET